MLEHIENETTDKWIYPLCQESTADKPTKCKEKVYVKESQIDAEIDTQEKFRKLMNLFSLLNIRTPTVLHREKSLSNTNSSSLLEALKNHDQTLKNILSEKLCIVHLVFMQCLDPEKIQTYKNFRSKGQEAPFDFKLRIIASQFLSAYYLNFFHTDLHYDNNSGMGYIIDFGKMSGCDPKLSSNEEITEDTVHTFLTNLLSKTHKHPNYFWISNFVHSRTKFSDTNKVLRFCEYKKEEATDVVTSLLGLLKTANAGKSITELIMSIGK